MPGGKKDSVFGWGVNVSTGVKTFGKDNVVFAVAGGHGVSRYIQDTSGLGIDAEPASIPNPEVSRSEEHTSELQSHLNLVCRLLLEKKKYQHPLLQHGLR